MTVVCDNSALSALAEVGLLFILPAIFDEIVVTRSVFDEGSHPAAPEALRNLLASPPEWLKIHPDPEPLIEEALHLGPGEAASITLCHQQKGKVLLIIDEKRGRNVAAQLGIARVGVLAIVGQAARRNLLDFDEVVRRLTATGFRIHPAIIDAVRRTWLQSPRD